MNIRYAIKSDYKRLSEYDKHISNDELLNSIANNRIIVMCNDEQIIGWLRYNLFWDNTPFMNMLYFIESERGKGYGTKLVSFWEKEMKKLNYDIVLTSTQSNEQGQFFYRKNGYLDSGALILPNEPLEIILYKKI